MQDVVYLKYSKYHIFQEMLLSILTILMKIMHFLFLFEFFFI